MIVYHDGPGHDWDNGEAPQRRLHAECLFSGLGLIPRVLRQPLDARYGFEDCVGDGAFEFSALKMGALSKNYPLVTQRKDGAVLVSEQHVDEIGIEQRFKLYGTSNDQYLIQSLVNKKYVCTSARTNPLKAACTDGWNASARFSLEFDSSGAFQLYHDALDRYVGVGDDGLFYADATNLIESVPFVELSLD